MTRPEQISLVDALIREDEGCTIRDYLDTMNEVDGITVEPELPKKPKILPLPPVVKKRVANRAPVRVIIVEDKGLINTVGVARRIGFAAALDRNTVYGHERNKWRFQVGEEWSTLEEVFRRAYKHGRQVLNQVLIENANR